MSTPLNESKAESNQTTTVKMGNRTVERPSKRYPLGVASDATMFAGKNMVINADMTQKMNGEFYAGHFLAGRSVNDTQDQIHEPGTIINNFKDTSVELPNNLNPSIVSATTFSDSMVKIITNSGSLVNKNGDRINYVMGKSSKDLISEDHFQQIFPWSPGKIDDFKKLAYRGEDGEQRYLGGIDYFSNNNVSTAEQAISNVTNVSDYYANLTATEYDSNGHITGYKQSVFSDAIKSVSLNSKAVNGSNLGVDLNKDVIQVNIDMNTESTDTGVAVIDIDGAANDGLFQKANGIVINLLNFTQDKQKVPYIIFNYHNFKTFNFESKSTFNVNAYSPEQVQKETPNNNVYYPSRDSGLYSERENLAPTGDDKKYRDIRFSTAAHILNNFNTIDGGSDAAINLVVQSGDEDGYQFIGTLLAPHTSINIGGAPKHSFTGNVITNNSIYLAGDVDIDKAFGANFNNDGDFPGTSDLEPTTKVPRILSVDLPNSVNFSPENATTNYVFEYSLNNNTAIDPPSSTMHQLDGVLLVIHSKLMNRREPIMCCGIG